MFSAYTIRKILPRLLIAVIAIQLSWWLVVFAVKTNNDIAHGLEGLIYAPFGGAQGLSLGSILHSQNAGAFSASVFTGAAAGTIGVLTIGPGTALGILAFAGTAALGMLIAIFTLVLRRAVLLFLIVLAPIAIAAWVLPGTQKLWKLWWESFSKLLLMYPLILLLIAAGRIFAKVSGSPAAGTNQFLSFGMIILGFFGPLFMIPATLKLAGTAFSVITGAVNSRNKGLFDRLRNARANEGQKNREKVKSGNKFMGGTDTNFRGKINSALMGASMINKAGWHPIHSGMMKDNMISAMSERKLAAADQVRENQTYKNHIGDDDWLWAYKEGKDMESIKSVLKAHGRGRFDNDENGLNIAAASVMRAQRETGRAAGRIAATIDIASTGTGYNYGVEGDDMLTAINSVSGADRTLAGAIYGKMRPGLLQSGRVDLGANGYAIGAMTLDDMYTASNNKGPNGKGQIYARDANGAYMYEKDAAGNDVYEKDARGQVIKDENGVAQKKKMMVDFGVEEAWDRLLDNANDSSAVGQSLYGKPKSAERLAKRRTKAVQNIIASLGSVRVDPATGQQIQDINPDTGRPATQRDLDQELAGILGIHDAMATAPPQIARAFADEFNGGGPEGTGEFAMIEDPRSHEKISVFDLAERRQAVSPEMAQIRKDYATRVTQEGAAAQAASLAAAAAAAGAGAGPGGGLPPGLPPPPFRP